VAKFVLIHPDSALNTVQVLPSDGAVAPGSPIREIYPPSPAVKGSPLPLTVIPGGCTQDFPHRAHILAVFQDRVHILTACRAKFGNGLDSFL
jgi:hypothetical protein